VYGYLLQDWTTIRGSTLALNPAGIVQSESDWMSFQPYQDIVFWTDVKSISLGGLTNIALDYETAPAKDDLLFRRMKTATSTFTGIPCTNPRSRRCSRRDADSEAWTPAQRDEDCSSATADAGTVTGPIGFASSSASRRPRVRAQYFGASSR
jgi:hypothetical protein